MDNVHKKCSRKEVKQTINSERKKYEKFLHGDKSRNLRLLRRARKKKFKKKKCFEVSLKKINNPIDYAVKIFIEPKTEL